MKSWIAIITIFLIGHQYTLADDLKTKNIEQSNSTIIIGIITIVLIVFILIRRQKRRFND